jgi:hypothetical protein
MNPLQMLVSVAALLGFGTCVLAGYNVTSTLNPASPYNPGANFMVTVNVT